MFTAAQPATQHDLGLPECKDRPSTRSDGLQDRHAPRGTYDANR